MATEYTLERADGRPFGRFWEVQAMLRRVFPNVQFFWTTSGAEKMKLARQRGVDLPPMVRAALEQLPSLLEGIAASDDYHVTFGLGHEEPVTCLYVTPRGMAAELDRGLAALEAIAGAPLQVAGT